MAGHSKWANIKHTKAREDKKRGKIFTKLIRQVQVAARLGGGDPASNPRLRGAVADALAANMPRNTIEKAIKRGAGTDEANQLFDVRYEGYGPNGIAIIIDCLTDNKNRTVAEVRHALTKAGGNLGTDGSVAYLFNKTGLITLAPGSDEDAVMEVALEAGANDVTTHEDGSIDVLTAPADFDLVKKAIIDASFTIGSAKITFLAENEVALDDEAGVKLLTLLDRLEDLDDVQEVYSNADISDTAINTYASALG